MKYAIIENGIVANVVKSDSPLGGNWVEDSEGKARIGGVYDGQFHDAIEPLPTEADYEKAIDAYLNAIALQHGYDNIVSACSYAGAVNPFQAESIKFIKWRGDVWAHAVQILNDVKNGTQPQPTIEEAIDSLPIFGG